MANKELRPTQSEAGAVSVYERVVDGAFKAAVLLALVAALPAERLARVIAASDQSMSGDPALDRFMNDDGPQEVRLVA